MPKKCCVPGCNSNYASTTDYVTVFKFPTDSDMREKWKQCVPRKDWSPSKSTVVCSKHFRPCEIIWSETFTDNNGVQHERPRKNAVLKANAFPSLFPGLPSYFNISLPQPRRDPKHRASEIVSKYDKRTAEWLLLDIINNFAALQCQVTEKLKDLLARNWKLHAVVEGSSTCLVLYNICVKADTAPSIAVSVKVLPDMCVQVYVENKSVADKHLHWIFPNNKLERWSQLENLLIHYNDTDAAASSTRKNISDLLEDACHNLDIARELMLSSEDTDIQIKEKQLTFITEQLQLINKDKFGRRYSNCTLCFSYMVFLKSPACYRFIRKSLLLCLPHANTLRSLTSSHSLSTDDGSIHHYMKFKECSLSELERIVAVQMDEIFVKSSITYSGGRLVGRAENAAQSAATIQAFMISSVFGNYQEVVELVPMHRMTSEDLSSKLLQVINIVQQCGFTVLAVIADNSSVNRKVYTSLLQPNSTYIENPSIAGKRIFLLYDSVHLLKCVWRNWINQKDPEQTLSYPSTAGLLLNVATTSNCTGSNKTASASFSHLRQLHQNEHLNIAKLAPTLTYKSLSPSSIDRQKVSLALAIFSEYNIAALRLLGDQETADFIDVIWRWWHIVNVKSKFSGRNTRNTFANPLTSVNHESLHFLKNFVVWLKEWGQLPTSKGKLTRETHAALLHTVTAMIELADYSFATLNVEFILCGKLQTDNLEARFSEYRQLSGANYLVSVKQILEAEKKLKVYSLLSLTSSVYGNFSIRNFAETMSQEEDECDLCEDGMQSDVDKVFFHIDPYEVELFCANGSEEALLYIAGFVANKISRKAKCISCKALLQIDKALTVDVEPEISTEYIQLLDRGGLKYPSKLIMLMTFLSYAAMQRLISPEWEALFLACKQHKKLLTHIVTCSLLKYCADEVSGVCDNGCPKVDIISMALSPLSNVFLNNYRKIKNDSALACSSQKRKLAKFV